MKDSIEQAAICEDLIKKGTPFVDKVFPAETKSLGDASEVDEETKAKIGWKKARDKFNGDYDVFRGISPDDIVQGDLGTCYFISAISALSEYPNRIEKMFVTPKRNEAGCYGIRLYASGVPRIVYVDEFFPCFTKRWAYTHSRENEIWVSLIEKAWAKVFGTYGHISGGDGRESLYALTGAPVEQVKFDVQKKEEIWQKLKEADDSKYVMTCGGVKVEANGLFDKHAYSFLGVAEVEVKGKGKVRLAHIRNPHGENEWQGEWSDNSSEWTPELRKQLNQVAADDGAFYMKYDDFFSIYQFCFICKFHDEYIYSHLAVPEHEACVVFQVTNATKGFLTIHTTSHREYGADFTKRTIIELYQYKNKQLSIIGKPIAGNFLGAATTDVNLEPGVYLLHGKYHNNDLPPKKHLCFIAYASKPVNFVLLPGRANLDGITFQDVMKPLEEDIKKRNVTPTEKIKVQGTLDTCPKGHPLNYKTDKKGGYRCDKCKTKCEGPRFTCGKCPYDICTKCRPVPGESEEQKSVGPPADSKLKEAPTVGDKCTKGHPYILDLPPGADKSSFLCFACGKLDQFSSKRWICNGCKAYICKSCKSTPESEKVTASSDVPLICPLKHKLKFDYIRYEKNMFVCERCDRRGDCTSGRWRCPNCNYDICTVCAPGAPEKADVVDERSAPTHASQPVVRLITTACESGHPLFYSFYSCLTGEYECNKCLQHFQCKDGRWYCVLCDYDICQTCRAPPADIESTKKWCNSGHMMIQTRNRYPEGNFYRCSFCKKAKSSDGTRWWCPICQYDICNECGEKDIEAMDFPEEKDITERRCKDKHFFLKVGGAEEDFECEKESNIVSKTQKFMCRTCGMVQCPNCAKESGVTLDETAKTKTKIFKEDDEVISLVPTAGSTIALADKASEDAAINEKAGADKRTTGGIDLTNSPKNGDRKGDCCCFVF